MGYLERHSVEYHSNTLRSIRLLPVIQLNKRRGFTWINATQAVKWESIGPDQKYCVSKDEPWHYIVTGSILTRKPVPVHLVAIFALCKICNRAAHFCQRCIAHRGYFILLSNRLSGSLLFFYVGQILPRSALERYTESSLSKKHFSVFTKRHEPYRRRLIHTLANTNPTDIFRFNCDSSMFVTWMGPFLEMASNTSDCSE